MDRNPSSDDENKAKAHLRKIDDTYVFDSTSGIYKPKTYTGQTDSKQTTKRIKWESPVRVRVARDWISVVIAALTLYVVAMYTDYARRQWEAMDDATKISASQFRIARQTFRETARNFQADQRAWLSPSTITGLPQRIGQPLDVSLRIKNTGKTPAENLRFELMTKPVPQGEILQFTFTGIKTHSRGFLAPEAEFENTVHVSPVITQAEVDALKSGRWHVYVYGRVFYQDIFRQHHQMTFCYYIDPTGTFFTVCEQYNETDNE